MSHGSRLLAISILLVCACATRPPAPAVPVPLVNSGQEEVVEQKLAAIAQFVAQARDEPPIIQTGIRGSELIVAPAAVRAILAVKARVLEEFKDPRFVAIHRKLLDAFATVGENNLSYEPAPDGGEAVTSISFLDVLQKIGNLATKVPNQADVRTTFTVHSDPPGATFALCPQYLDTGCIHVTAEATIAAVFRGLYSYRVSLDGYKTVAYPLDLVHFTQTRLDCRLKAKTASPCTPR